MKIRGESIVEIAKTLGWAAPSSALRAYERYSAKLALDAGEDLEAARRLELQRLEAMQSAIWDKALGHPADRARHRSAAAPNNELLNTLLRIHDRRVRLLGLDREPMVDPEQLLRDVAAELGEDPEEVIREAEGIAALTWRKTSRRKR